MIVRLGFFLVFFLFVFVRLLILAPLSVRWPTHLNWLRGYFVVMLRLNVQFYAWTQPIDVIEKFANSRIRLSLTWLVSREIFTKIRLIVNLLHANIFMGEVSRVVMTQSSQDDDDDDDYLDKWILKNARPRPREFHSENEQEQTAKWIRDSVCSISPFVCFCGKQWPVSGKTWKCV